MTHTDGLSRGELQDKAIQGALWTLVHVVVSLPLAFAVNIVIARTLGVVDYGRLAYLGTVMLLVATVVDLGVVSGVVQFGSKSHAAGRSAEVTRLLSASKGYRTVVGMPLIAVAVLVLVDVDPGLMAVAIAFGVVLPCVLGGAGEALGIESKTAKNAQAAMIVNLVTQVLVVVVATTVGTADSIWVVRLVTGGLGVLLFLVFVSRTYRRALMRPRLRGFPPGFWRFALPAGAASMVAAFVLSRSEVLVLTWMSQVHAAGVFALAIGLASHLFAPAQSLVGPLVPAISGLHEVDGDAVGRALGRTLRASSTVMAAIVAAAMPAFAFVVPLIYGDEFSDVPEVLLALGVAGGLLVIAEPIKAFVAARLKGMWLLWLNLTTLAVSVGLMVLLIPHLGVWGAVISNLGSAVVLVSLLIVTEVRAVGTGTWRALGDVSSYFVGVLACLVAWWGTGRLDLPAVWSALVAGVVGLGLVVGVMRLTRRGLTPQDAVAVQRSLPGRVRTLLRGPLRLVTTGRDVEQPAPARGAAPVDAFPGVGAP
ncbi:lipopolysaccharide biosynthesis protein [Isoptericola sp. NPDC057391]|uniref:lipopolysaccharide biosynthesis protein n=1 Tax=Isoptericola sp. NPDC057391 TaxID=3346117 RepID=UPI003639568D